METNHFKNHYPEILLLIFSSLGIFGLLVRCAILVIPGIINFSTGSGSGMASLGLDIISMLFCAGLVIPVLVLTDRSLKKREIPQVVIRPIKFWQGGILLPAWVVVVITGSLLVKTFEYGWVVAAPFFLLGVCLPILALVWVGTRDLPGGSHLWLWSVFDYGLIGSTFIAIMLEYLMIAFAAVIIGVLVVVHPELKTLLDEIKMLVINANTGDLQTLLIMLSPYLTKPLVILSILGFASILTPLIEEAVKPVIIWILGKKLRSPAEGFVLGALCGAGFALMEGLLAVSNASQMWSLGMAGRAAASLMHITSSGLLGWAISSAILEKRYDRLVLTYLLSVSIHGLWNGSAVMAVYGALRVMGQNQPIDYLGAFLVMGGFGSLFLEMLILLFALPLINRRLRLSAEPILEMASSDIIPPPTTSSPRDTDELDSKNH